MSNKDCSGLEFVDRISSVLSEWCFHIGWLRYWGGSFVAVGDYDNGRELFNVVLNLSGGDCEAFIAKDRLESFEVSGDIVIGIGTNPVSAMIDCCKKIDNYYNED